MYLALVLLATLHGLVFMPVALSVFGGEGSLAPSSAGGSSHGGFAFGLAGDSAVRSQSSNSSLSLFPWPTW